MATAFASLQARTNLAIMARLSDTVATLDGAEVLGMFDNPYELGGLSVGMASSLPTFTLPSSSVPDDWEGKRLSIADGNGAGAYLVREHRPDGTGMSILALELAS